MSVPPAPRFADDDEYERSLTDADFWAPYARAALRLSGLPDDGEVRTYFPTTHVAALIGERYLVKLHYEDRFGEDCFQNEREAYRHLGGHDELPIPQLLSEGALYDEGWRWPFLVMTAMPGRSLRELGDDPTREDRDLMAVWLGRTVRAIHGVPIRDGERLSHELYVDLIQTRAQRCHRDHELWGSLPERLRSQVRDYVWGARHLIDPEREPPMLLHGDLHAGKVFLDGPPGALEPAGVVDFNDAYEGDRHYDLVAIHVKTFGGDKRALSTFLDAYGWDDLGRDWARRMMALTLAHDYDMVRPVMERSSLARQVAALEDLATIVWDLDAPDLA
ncbi:MAG TPA: aminoglycoside phosphotransferase family protein [Actinomycetota bacterium]|jgi:aminoglycoside phosphotransferase (APT) family kinase protein|nr:aminoglycoside phosphotransferase family protein [Actinomycetota bacterium]